MSAIFGIASHTDLLPSLPAHPPPSLPAHPPPSVPANSSMSKLGTWGDHVTLQAAADAYHVGICIVTSFLENCVITIRCVCVSVSLCVCVCACVCVCVCLGGGKGRSSSSSAAVTAAQTFVPASSQAATTASATGVLRLSARRSLCRS